MPHYLFIGGPYHDTFQLVKDGSLIWNLPEPRGHPIPCYPHSPSVERAVAVTVHTYRRRGLTRKGKFLGYLFAEINLTNKQAIDLFLELKRI
jgi:hypothetical protein